MIDKDKIIDVLKTCYDPEIPIDLWNLGLIYDIKIDKKSNLEITMTLTTPGCTMANHIAEDAKAKLLQLKDIGNVNINITFEPPWSPEMLTEDGKVKLGLKKEKNIQEEEEEEENWE